MPLMLRAVIRFCLSFALLGWLYFGLSLRPDWLQGRIFLGILLATVIANLLVLRHDHELLAERMRGVLQRGQDSADRLLLICFITFYGAWFILMPLQMRLGLSGDYPAWLQALGAATCSAGSGIVVTCFAQNSFLSAVVRIQRERGHRLVDHGLYGVVRHPMYLGVILLLQGGPLLLCSSWGTLAGSLGALMLVLRTGVEERVLCRELEGYADYRRRVRWRLVPGIF